MNSAKPNLVTEEQELSRLLNELNSTEFSIKELEKNNNSKSGQNVWMQKNLEECKEEVSIWNKEGFLKSPRAPNFENIGSNNCI